MLRLYGNENVPMPTVLALRTMGFDVLTAVEAGLANQGYSDVAGLAYANAESRVFLTNDRPDFRRLHAQELAHVGIVEFKRNPDFQALADRIKAALEDSRAVGRFYASVTRDGHSFR